MNEDIGTRYILKTARQDFTSSNGWVVRNLRHTVLALQYNTTVVHVLLTDNSGKYFKDFINLNCITNSCNWYSYVTWQGNEY
jgi:hypothetical protein